MINYLGNLLDKLSTIDRNAQLTFTTSTGEHSNYDVVTDGVVNVQIQLGESEAEAELEKLEAALEKMQDAIDEALEHLKEIDAANLEYDGNKSLDSAIDKLESVK